MQGVGKTFGTDVEALREMSLEVHFGDFVSLLGPSGCGKSTALRIIANLISPTRGRVVWSGDNRQGSVGVVFQEPTLMPWASVAKNVWLPHRLSGMSLRQARPKIQECLEVVGLEDFADSYPRELSGGMKMRVSIARALVTDPRIILMDEPFAALDEITRFKLNNDLLKLKENVGCTVIFVTHSVFESVFLSNRIAVMVARPGRVFEEVTVGEGYPRDESFRTSSSYASYCRKVSESLRRGIEAST